MKSLFSLALVLTFFLGNLALSALPATEQLDVTNLEISSTGQFNFHGLTFSSGQFDINWNSTEQNQLKPDTGFPRKTGTAWELSGRLQPKSTSTPIIFTERLERMDADSFRAHYQFSHGDGIPTQETYLRVDFPLSIASGQPFSVDDAPHRFPTDFQGMNILTERSQKSHKLTFPAAGGIVTIEGVFDFQIQDRRQWKINCYSVRLRFFLSEKLLKASSLQAIIRFSPYQSSPLSLREYVNRGFADNVAGDTLGGWTDEGPANDLSCIHPGILKAAGISFEIISPAANRGKSALVLGKNIPLGSSTPITIPIPKESGWRNLYLLHAAAQLPASGETIGILHVTYQDGTESRHEVITGRDVDNWWAPLPLSNGAVGWTGENGSSPVGLYVSRFALEPKSPIAVRFEATEKALWMVVAASGSSDDIRPFTPQLPYVSAVSKQWSPYAHTIEIEPGSVFDFSALTDAPAGKYGPLHVNTAGQFEFTKRPGIRAKFWGVNLVTGAIYLENKEADRLAERLARSGYNSVRIHHFDHPLIQKDGKSYDFDSRQLDRLDYLFAALKRRGIYINIDLFTLRGFSSEELASFQLSTTLNRTETRARFKALLPISPEAFESWKQFSHNLLTHRNPYTQLTWADDPALIGICPVNEDTLTPDALEKFPEIQKRYDSAFAEWMESSHTNRIAGADRATLYNQFLSSLQAKSNQHMFAYLRSMGVKALLTGTNYKETQAQTYLQNDYDYVDNHMYWDHPQFPEKRWALPQLMAQASATHFFAKVPGNHMANRFLGKPYSITEFNFVRPNAFRAEGGILMPAYASLQDWDALYNYKYANTEAIAMEGIVDRSGNFSIASDPINLLADRLSALLFLRGDIAPAIKTIGYAVDPATAFAGKERGFPAIFSRLGLISRIGSQPGDPASILTRNNLDAVVTSSISTTSIPHIYPDNETLYANLERDGILPSGSIDADRRKFVSDTRQITLDVDAGSLIVVTPRSELFISNQNLTLTGKQVTLRNSSGFCTVSIIALDDQPLSSSRRILIVHLTDAMPTGMRFANQDRRLLLDKGHAPFLIAQGSVDIFLKVSNGTHLQAWAVDASGKRLREISLQTTPEGWQLHAETVTAQSTQMAYEIIRP